MNVFGFKIQKINVKLRFIEETKKKSSKDIMRYNKPKWGDRYVQKGVMQFNDWQCMLGVTLPTVAEILIKSLLTYILLDTTTLRIFFIQWSYRLQWVDDRLWILRSRSRWANWALEIFETRSLSRDRRCHWCRGCEESWKSSNGLLIHPKDRC